MRYGKQYSTIIGLAIKEFKKSNYLESEKLFKKLIPLLTRYINDNPKDDMAYFDRANIKLDMLDYDSAINDYNFAIELNSSNPKFYYHRANAYQGLKKYIDAINNYDMAINLNPIYKEAYYGRAKVKKIIGDTVGANNDLAKIKEIDVVNNEAEKRLDKFNKLFRQ